jgi:hypothetical protein
VQVAGKSCLKDEQLLLGNRVEGRFGYAEILRKDFPGSMREPIGNQECVELVEVSIVEYQQKAAAIRT